MASIPNFSFPTYLNRLSRTINDVNALRGRKRKDVADAFWPGLERYRTVYMGMRSSRVVYRAICLQMLKSQQSWVQFQHPPPRGYGVHA